MVFVFSGKPSAREHVAALPSALPRLRREVVEVIGLYALTLVTFSWVFPPHGIWPLTCVCLAPWAVATCRTRRAWLVHWASFALGAAFFLFNLRWLDPVTRAGYIALSLYLALYWPLAAWALRTGQRHGISPIWTLPVAWIACELLRAWVMTGFPWLFLAHAVYAQLPLIQISDLVGAYGVSFLIALVNGVLAELVLHRWRRGGMAPRWRQLRGGVVCAVVVLAGTLGYGAYRLGQDDFAPGPRVAVVQHDFPLVSRPPYGAPRHIMLAEYLRLAAEAAAEKPDLLVFPETVWAATQNLEFLAVEHNVVEGLSLEEWIFGKFCHEAAAALARGDYAQVNFILRELEIRYGVPEHHGGRLARLPGSSGPPVTVVVGATAVETNPEATYPKSRRYNSALVYDPDGRQRPRRYDKTHLVPLGEVVPFRNWGFGLHRVYRWLNGISPFSYGGKYEYSLTPGDELTVFDLRGAERDYRFGTPICYEDVMPYVMRRYAWHGGRRRVDFLVNISNDGWFMHGNELPQHLAICAFRAVENRVGIARAVNTGVSGFIDPNGRIYSLVERDGRWFGPGVVGWRVERVPLDRRGSFYARTGDWFAGLCLILTVILWTVAVIERWVLAIRLHIAAWRRKRRRAHASGPQAR